MAVSDLDLDPPRSAEAGQGKLDQLEPLRFLHRVARLATTAGTWEELLETIVDETRDVLHADVSSLYLLDRDGAYLTLAATNGLDRYQIGRARVPQPLTIISASTCGRWDGIARSTGISKRSSA